MQTRFAPQDAEQIARALAAGYDLEAKFELDDLASGERFVFVLTGITDGVLARGVREADSHFALETFILDSALGEPVVIDLQVPKA
jgi:fructose-1,6-bisphosphatase/sedoheptulose 1,7-bisphosphatase-like protein